MIFIVTAGLKTSIQDEIVLNKRFRIATRLYNNIVKEARRRLNNYYMDRDVKTILNKYKEEKKITAEDKKVLREKNKEYKLSKYDLSRYMTKGRQQYLIHLDADSTDQLAFRVGAGVENVLYRKGNSLHLMKCENMRSIRSKSNSSGIRYKNGHILWKGLDMLINSNSDAYFDESLARSEIKYCGIVRRKRKGRWVYSVQITMSGELPVSHQLGKGRVGIDIGTSTVAVVSNDGVMLRQLGDGIDDIDNKLRILNRKLDRQRRVNNPDCYNSDGTIKRGIKLNWKFSKEYHKTRNKIHDLYQLRKDRLKLSHEILANEILALGDEFYVESMNFSGLQKRAKETEISEKTGKFKRKKRFGKSLGTYAPAMLIEILNRKLASQGKEVHKINTTTAKASQYNHFTDEYNKKSLSTRWATLDNENKIQRDLYSAFLIMNIDDSLKTIDKKSCDNTYDNFKEKHDALINELKQSDKKFRKSMGI